MEQLIRAFDRNDNFSSHSKRDPLIISVLEYIKSKKRTRINTLFIHKELYIVVGTHGSMVTNDNSYKTIKIPSKLNIYRLPQTQYGVCSYNDSIYKKYIYETVLYEILNTPSTTISLLKGIAHKLFDYNDQIQLNMIQPRDPVRYSHFKRYTKDNIPDISYFKGESKDVMMDKVIIIEIYVNNGALVVEDNIFIVNPKYTFEDSISLLDYIDPFLYVYNNHVLYLHYKLSDIINFLQGTTLKKLIMIDLSCSSGHKDNTFKIIEDAAGLEKKQNISPHKPAIMSKSMRVVNAFTAQHTRRKTGARSYFNKNEMFYPPINVLAQHSLAQHQSLAHQSYA
jgi:hypothetical protein